MSEIERDTDREEIAKSRGSKRYIKIKKNRGKKKEREGEIERDRR